MGIRKLTASPGYEEMDGNNLPEPPSKNSTAPSSLTASPHPSLPPSEFELASVSVVPDGKFGEFQTLCCFFFAVEIVFDGK